MAERKAAGAPGGVKPGEIKALSGVRGVGAIAIVLYHFATSHHYVPFGSVLAAPVTKGFLWVEFFFALSGFVLVHAYHDRQFRYGEFLKARVARLYPIHFVTLLSMLALMLAINALATHFHFNSIFHGYKPPTNTPGSFVANLFLVQAWGFVPALTWNGAAWFVSVEFFLCLVFPAYLAAARGGIWRGAAMFAFGAAWLVVLEWNSGVGLDITFNNGIFRGMADFSIGAGLATMFRELKDRPVPESLLSLAQAGTIAVIVAAIYLAGPRHSRGDVITGLALILLIPALAFDKGFLARLFQKAPFQILGAWSYAIYMGQTFWMQVVWQFDPMLVGGRNVSLFGIRLSKITWYAEPLILLAVCVLWGALLSYLVERPAHNRLKKLTWTKPASETAPRSRYR